MRKNGFLFILALLFVLAVNLFTIKAADIQKAPVWDGETYLGRNYDADFDKMFDNFERATLIADANTAGMCLAEVDGSDVDLTSRTSYLRANYSNTLGTTLDAPIYKVGSIGNSNGSYANLVLEMKKGSDTASINDLILAFRYDDNHEDIYVPFTELLDPMGEVMPELTDSYQLYIIHVLNTLDGKQYDPIEGKSDSAIEAGGVVVGLHLLADKEGTGVGTVDIQSVYWTNKDDTLGYSASENDYLLDDFNRTVLSEANDKVWWRGGGPGSEIIGKWLAFDYTSKKAVFREAGYDPSNATGAFENVVFRIKGTVGGEDILISPFYVVDGSDVYGDPVALSTLKGPDDKVVPGITTGFQNIVVNFEKSGWEKNVNGFKLESKDGETGLVYIDDIFFTNMEYDASQTLTEYPLIDPTNLLVFDDFSRQELIAYDNYDASVANPKTAELGFKFILSYHGLDRLSLAEGSLVFDCSTNEDYINYKPAKTEYNDGSYDYVVFKMKGTDGASLEGFHFATLKADDSASNVVWGNGGLKSGTGLPIPDFDTENYPYTTEDGYIYVIVDLAASGLTDEVAGFDMYYSGSGKLFIDAIFFANSGVPTLDMDNRVMFDDFNRTEFSSDNYWYYLNENASIVDNAAVLDSLNQKHSYIKFASPTNNADNPKEYLVLKMKGDEGTTLESFRMQIINADGDSPEKFYNQDQLVSFPGVSIPEVSTNYQYFIIDLEASGLPANAQGIIVTFGDWAAGKLYIDEIFFADRLPQVDELEEALAEVDDKPDNGGETTTTTTEATTTTTTEQTTTTTEDTTSDDKKDDKGLSEGIIAAIIGGGVILVGGVTYFFISRRRLNR